MVRSATLCIAVILCVVAFGPGSGRAQGQGGNSGNPRSTDAPEGWIQRGTAELIALDKVRAQAAPLTVKVGQTVAFHSLQVTVRACAVRPNDVPADATAFLEVTDSAKGAPGFRGWMIASLPSTSMMQHPIYDLRVVGCRP